jgi:omega-6 fatty acid desaturase (delta-12 desaturase)
MSNSAQVATTNADALDARALREVVQPFTKPGFLLPLCILVIDALAYLGLTFLAVTATSLTIRLVASITCGLAIGLLFVVGHDACHGSLTKNSLFNSIIGRLAFLPSLHAFSLWALGHNRIHHRYTNLRTHDYVWMPYTKEEFDALPPGRRFRERMYRTVLGQGLYYAIEIWWKKMLFPNRREVPERRSEYFWDSSLCVTWWIGQLVALALIGKVFGHSIGSSFIFGWVIPFAVWNWLMGFLVYQHHTHPTVAWYDRQDEWEYMEAQIEGTTHVRFPPMINWLLHNIMEHTAHHAMTTIPLYRLQEAQRAIEQRYAERVHIIEWRWNDYIDTVRRCKLYDYRRRVWLDFSGRPTTGPVP